MGGGQLASMSSGDRAGTGDRAGAVQTRGEGPDMWSILTGNVEQT